VKQIVLIGGGYSGLAAAQELRRALRQTVDLTLVDPRSTSLARPMLPEVGVQGLPLSQTQFDIAHSLRRIDVRFVQSRATAVDPIAQFVTLADGSRLPYDLLLMNPGAVHDFAAVEGLDRYGESICDEPHAAHLADTLSTFREGRILVGSAPFRQGSPDLAPHLDAACEGPVGELLFMLDRRLREAGIRDRVELSAFTPGERFFDDVGDEVHAALDPLLASHGIAVHTGYRLTGLAPGEAAFEGGRSLSYDLAIVIPNYRGHRFVQDAGLGDDAGFVPADETMRHGRYPNVFAAGDAASRSVPKLGHIAVLQATIAARAMARDLGARVAIPPYRPEVFCIMGMGEHEATLIQSDVLFGGQRDLAVRGHMPHFLKESLDRYYVRQGGRMPPAFTQSFLEFFLPYVPRHRSAPALGEAPDEA
jgi:sulfide:quinone oxidoreductase